MSRPRRRLTLGGALFLVAFVAGLLAMERFVDGFGILIACFTPIVILGFVLHRIRGGDGLLGAILGGGIGCAIFGGATWLIDVFVRQGSSPGRLDGLGSYFVVFLALFGMALG